ncbi:NUDIX hydrolase [Amycolatopsis thailandensis]|uniref:NUDIX hydrolase n=1 Tax=Amycolatopsis thailandensis TaxID=589330 RepID=A0A229RNX1_9PSEU|nr:NUDIX domain-containing protein [Amycolatopsis thailandensis]OXM48357.1 NUDIX hydrolase [Amycolatopsis thailandensis]
MTDDDWTIPEITVAVDLAILTVKAGSLQIMLVKRGIPPFEDELALPGGFLESTAEDLDSAAARELTEETGLRAEDLHLEQLKTYGGLGRDPRGRVVSVCYVAFTPNLPAPAAGGDAREVILTPVDDVLRPQVTMAFDHKEIVADAVERARNKLEYTTLGATFCAPEFTITDLRQVYEIVWGERLDPRNFHRKITSVPGFLTPTGGRVTRQAGRPAALYRRGPATILHPAMLRT